MKAIAFACGVITGIGGTVLALHERAPAAAPGFTVSASFDNAGTLQPGARVALAGVSIGEVTAIRFDPREFAARVEMRIEAGYDMIPLDSSASIVSAGLFGEQYVSLAPGAAEENLSDGSHIAFTQSALVLEQLIGQFVYSQTR